MDFIKQISDNTNLKIYSLFIKFSIMTMFYYSFFSLIDYLCYISNFTRLAQYELVCTYTHFMCLKILQILVYVVHTYIFIIKCYRYEEVFLLEKNKSKEKLLYEDEEDIKHILLDVKSNYSLHP